MFAIEDQEIDLLEWHRYQIEMKTEMLAKSESGSYLTARYPSGVSQELVKILPQQILAHIRTVELLTRHIEGQDS